MIRQETLCNAAKAIVEIGGAKEVSACATHGVLSGPAIERIQDSVLKEVVLLDTIALPEEKRIDKIKMLKVGPVFAEAIARIYETNRFPRCLSNGNNRCENIKS